MATRSACLLLSLTGAVVGLAAQAPPSPRSVSDQFYAAVRSDTTAATAALLQGGADVNVKDRRGGATPLMYAAAFGSLPTLQLLIERGADVKARNATGATALMWAATDLAKVRLLLARGADVNAVSEGGRSALLLAAMSDGSAEIVKTLLAAGANARHVDKDKNTALTMAAFGNDTETIRQLIAAGADVNAVGPAGFNALVTSASHGNAAAVKLLLANGARVNDVTGPPAERVKNGLIALGNFTALSSAASFGPFEVVKALVDAGADINVKDARGMTALMLSVTSDHGDPRIAELLIAKGADVSAVSALGETALDWAQKSGATPMAALLKRAGAKAGTSIAKPTVPPAAPLAVQPAIARAVALLERSSNVFFTNGACGACHAQNVTDFAAMAARKHGVPINDQAAAMRANGGAAAFGATASRLLERYDTPAVDIQIFELASLAAASYPPDRATDALVANLAAQQFSDGRWHVGGIARPPIADGDFSRTGLAVRALDVYAPPGRKAEMQMRKKRAVNWLRSATPATGEDRAFQLLGMAWGGISTDALAAAARRILALQRADGGWSQRSEMSSDAYATGLTLYALTESGTLQRTDPAAERAVAYLLSTQRADGSWYVASRSPKFQPYFDGGFPYEHDQWISSMATGWAAAGLASALPQAGP